MRGRMERQVGTALMGKSASRVMRMAPAADRGVQGVVAGPAASSQADAVGMVASAALADQEALLTMARPANKEIPPPHSPTLLPAAWEERAEQGTLPSFQLAAIEPPSQDGSDGQPGQNGANGANGGPGYPPIAEASSVRAMGRMGRMDSMEAAEEVEGRRQPGKFYFVSLQISTVRGQVVVAAVRAARAAKAVKAAAAGEGRLEYIFIIMVPMVAL